MKTIVTGGAGFIGSHLCNKLIDHGHQVICIDNFATGKLDNIKHLMDHYNFQFVKSDILEVNINVFKDVDFVFHNACSKCTVCRDVPFKDLMVNAYGSWRTFHNAISHGKPSVKVIHASTGSVLGGKPKTFYGASKLAGQAYLSAFKEYYTDFDYTILQYYHVFGTRQNDSSKGGVIPIFIRQILNNQPVTVEGTGQQERHFTHVDDIVKANLASMAKGSEETFKVASDFKISILDLAKTLYRLMDKEENIVFLPPRQGDVMRFDIDNKPIKKLCNGDIFGWNFELKLLELIEFYKGKKRDEV